MRKFGIVVLAIMALTQISDRAPAQDGAKAPRNKLEGTWELTSAKYGEDTEYRDAPADAKRVKIVNATHFIWLAYDAQKKVPENFAGGTYTLVGDDYVEKIEFGSAETSELFGKDQKFKAKVEGDKWTHTGTLSSGLKLSEIWKRVK
jgi:hypothetical protein